MTKIRTALALFICLALFSCKKNSDDPGAAGTYYYEATIDGVAYEETVTDNNDYIAGSGLGGVDDVVFSADISPMTAAPNSTAIAINKGLYTDYLAATDAQFKAFFNPGNYPYAAYGGNGITINWMDKQGNNWSTDEGLGNQSGSSFKIISVMDDGNVPAYYIRVTAEFNCKLYDGNGNVKTLTNGKFIGLFGKI